MRLLFFLILVLLFFFSTWAQQKTQEVNTVLHDESYIAAYGHLPGANTSEQERVQLHLLYVEQLLRNADLTDLTHNQRIKRDMVLDLLNRYCLNANFPTNRDYPDQRRPCFIDADENICAVGFLISETKGRKFAEEINEKHQYDFLLDMHEPVIEEWAHEYGLTLGECAMIQPTYGAPPFSQTSYADIKAGYGISSGLAGGTNIAVNIINLSSRFRQNKTFSYLGLVTGAGQVIMGIANVKTGKRYLPFNGSEIYTSYKAQNNLSYVNIAMGTTTLITSALNLALQKKNKDKKNSFGLYSHPNYSNSVSTGMSFTRKI